MEHAAIIIEGAMHLHNFIIDYRNSNENSSADGSQCRGEEVIERQVFQDELVECGVSSNVTGQDSSRVVGRPRLDERDCRLRGLVLRDKLRKSIADHDMHRPRKNEWRQDSHMHIVLT